tara:strand:- start:3182 stop:3907 length:726 start_codon:yes stop_codon:yes gene_type:complete
MGFNVNDQIMVLSNKDQKFKAFVEYIRSGGHGLCMGKTHGIGKGFMLKSLLTTTHIAVVGTITNRQLRSGRESINFSKVRGFALLKDKPTFLYLDLICGVGTGAVIFKHIDQIAKKLNHTKIRLSAVPEAMLQYYKTQYGFVFSESCTMNNNVKNLANKVFEQVISLKITQKKLGIQLSKTTSSKNKKVIKMYQNGVNALVEEQLESLESLLGDKNIVAQKGCAKTKSCGQNGYTMTKCLR